MNDKVFKVLEFDKIKELLGMETVSPMALKAVGEIVPLSDIHRIKELLDETDEAVSVLLRKGALPLGGLCDVKRSVRYAEKGGVLGMRELLDIKSSLRAADSVKAFFRDEQLSDVPLLMEYEELINSEKKLADDIERCIINEDEMSDNASPELRNIRRRIASQRDAVRAKISAMASAEENRPLLQDDVVTIRGGRLVIPVKQENRARFPGVVHDTSATGATLFIEPQPIVALNNEIRELQVKEQEEIRHILKELSKQAGAAVRHIINNQKYLTRLDVIFAKAKFSVSYDGCSARLNEKGIMDIKKGRHPLISKDAVVPTDIRAGKDYRTLIITGPNTGGKTVALKTAGLLMLMNQSGMHIPAEYGTELPVMKKIFADIGDEQSIEQSLSTFSSHMSNIAEISREADSETFILLDELGAGTDPAEGAALAVSVLDFLSEKGSLIFATTHYSELKKYALSAPGAENASMEFDMETLSPVYRLNIGVPGRSNAFEISGRLGIDGRIIENARKLLGVGDIEFEDALTAIENDRKAAEEERDSAAEMKIRIQKQAEETERIRAQAEEKSRKIIEKARKQAFDMVAEAREFAEDVKRELQEIRKTEKSITDSELSRRQQILRRRLKDRSDEYREIYEPDVNVKPADRGELSVGDRVNVVSYGHRGTVASLPDNKDELLVEIGNIKVRVSLSDITKIDKNGVQKSFSGNTFKKKKKTGYSSIYTQKTMTISPSINVIGFSLDDAVTEVDKYLDDAYISGLKQVTVIHGRGEGILRNGLRQLFRKHKHVEAFQSGSYDDGGEAVTIVELKEE